MNDAVSSKKTELRAVSDECDNRIKEVTTALEKTIVTFKHELKKEYNAKLRTFSDKLSAEAVW
jgi:hypothetical protein